MRGNNRQFKLNGKITSLVKTRQRHNFIIDHIGSGLEATVLSASCAGLEGAAIAIASIECYEYIDVVEFCLNEEKVYGFFWFFPFQENDYVDLVAIRSGETCVAYGVRGLVDGIVAVYPHCFEGTRSHYYSVFRFWGIIVTSIFMLMMLLDTVFSIFNGTFSIVSQLSSYKFYFIYMYPFLLVVFAFLAWRSGRKTECFPQIAEMVFRGFGWDSPKNINLRKIAKMKRRVNDGKEYGIRYFRY
ncbi:putative type VI secretion system effector [Serratia quinivorans]|uniref:putative type VI secretion system effector n=1 Tax=Serratia quinivorans TaxID=137545 RepID=UPI0034C5D54F